MNLRIIFKSIAVFVMAYLLTQISHAEESCRPILTPQPLISPKLLISEGGQVNVAVSPQNSALGKVINGAFSRPLENTIRADSLTSAIMRLRFGTNKSDNIWKRMSLAFQTDFKDRTYGGPAKFPATGPVVIAANHVASGVETVNLAQYLVQQRARPDVKIVMNDGLVALEELREFAFFVDVSGTRQAKEKNKRTFAEMTEWLRQGNSLVIHPAGGISVKESLSDRQSKDPFWKTGLYDMIEAVPETTVITALVDREPSQSIHVARKIHNTLALPLVMRDVSAHMNSVFDFYFSKPHQGYELLTRDMAYYAAQRRYKHLQELPTSYSAFHRKAEELSLRAYLRKYAENKDLDLWKWEEILAAWRVEASRNVMEELRQEVYTLNKPQPLAKVENKVKAAPPQRQEEIVKHMFDHIVAREISRFVPIYDQDPANRDHGLALYVEKGGLSPILMHEIGVYREETFRRENEGTGRSIDFQELDRDYYQFIIWDKAKKQIVGGQRIGVISELVPSYSLDPSMRGVGPTQKRGVFPKLYTSESIDYSSLIYGEYFSFGAEISRTFIRPEYQNEPFPLAVMWSGLGQFLVRNSNIRYLLGTVSISGNLHPDSVRVIIGYTLKNHSSEKGKIVFPRKPVRIRGERSEEQIQEIIGRIKNAKGLEQEISTIEGSNGVKLNPLIKAYIAKGAKFLVWNHDAEFNTFDALIEDDLPHQPLRALKGYLGVDGAMSYLRDNGIVAE